MLNAASPLLTYIRVEYLCPIQRVRADSTTVILGSIRSVLELAAELGEPFPEEFKQFVFRAEGSLFPGIYLLHHAL